MAQGDESPLPLSIHVNGARHGEGAHAAFASSHEWAPLPPSHSGAARLDVVVAEQPWHTLPLHGTAAAQPLHGAHPLSRLALDRACFGPAERAR